MCKVYRFTLVKYLLIVGSRSFSLNSSMALFVSTFCVLMMCLRMPTSLGDKEIETGSTQITAAIDTFDSNNMTTASSLVPNRCKTYNESTRLCEGCKRGYYGENTCNKTCNHNCELNYCNITTGACKYGCRNTSDNSGTSPWYGPECNHKCSNKCQVADKCFRNGTCYLGCKNGTYGDMCEESCPINCMGSCTMKNGTCVGDCKPGFYGPHCNISCPKTCNESVCQRNGTCHGCISGYRESKCDSKCTQHCTSCQQFGDNCTSCETGRYGHKCITCDNCVGPCEFSDGQCSGGCRPGYFGPHCNDKCNSYCEETGNVITCKQANGHCSNGCVNGRYGNLCNRSCSSNCLFSKCSRSSGQCSIGCGPGYRGIYCNISCPLNCVECNRTNGQCFYCTNNRYGRQCENKCPWTCRNSSCDVIGTCTLGCTSGYYGEKCDKGCGDHCSTCGRYNGTCITCSPGRTGTHCTDSAKVIVFYVFVILLIIFAVCIAGALVHECIKRHSSGEGKNLRYFKNKWLHWSVCRSCSRHQRKWSPHACMHCDSKTLTLRDEDMNLLPTMSREEATSLTASRNRRSIRGKTDRYSFENNILFNNNPPSYSRYSCKTVSQCRRLEDRVRIQEGRSYVCTEVGSQISEHSSKVCRLSRDNHEPGRLLQNQNREQCEPSLNEELSKFDFREAVSESRRHDVDSYDYRIDIPDSVGTPMTVHHHPRQSMISVCVDKAADAFADDPDGSLEHFSLPTPSCTGHVAMHRIFVPSPIERWDFKDYVKRTKEHSGLDGQFKSLPQGKLAVCVEARRPENQAKNRYTNIHPYDHSRVILRNDQNDDSSDYINASYINGYGRKSFFIAAQGPFTDNIEYFLKMVYQSKATAIVMLTNLFENDRHKCGQYWPDTGSSRRFGDTLVHTLHEVAKADHCIRTLTVKQEGKKEHTLSQYHYTAWPDHGQPKDPRSLLDFYMDVKTLAFGEGPVIVHCSAGIGRTGTFIALDYLLDQANAEGRVDVHECVKRLRYQRMNMVQNQLQYVFLHDLLDLALTET